MTLSPPATKNQQSLDLPGCCQGDPHVTLFSRGQCVTDSLIFLTAGVLSVFLSLIFYYNLFFFTFSHDYYLSFHYTIQKGNFSAAINKLSDRLWAWQQLLVFDVAVAAFRLRAFCSCLAFGCVSDCFVGSAYLFHILSSSFVGGKFVSQLPLRSRKLTLRN